MDIPRTFNNFFSTLFGYLPNIIGFLVILLIGYIIAKIVKAVVTKVAQKLKVDEALQKSKAGQLVDNVSPGGRPSRLIGGVVFWLVFVYAITAAVGALGIPSVTGFMNQVLAYLPNVIAAILIFVVAAALATAVAALVKRTMGDTPTGKLVETVVPGVILAIAGFMILTQLGIAPAIVLITYGALVGMLALAGALAFGLGGREVAAQIWQQAYDRGREQTDQAKADLQTGKDRAQEQVQTAQQQASSSDGGAHSSSY